MCLQMNLKQYIFYVMRYPWHIHFHHIETLTTAGRSENGRGILKKKYIIINEIRVVKFLMEII